MKEEEIKKVASETGATASVLRATKKHMSTHTGGIRNTETSSSGTQTERPPTTDRSTGAMRYGQRVGTQTDRASTTTGDTQTDGVSGIGTQTDGPSTQIFDMTNDEAIDAGMADTEAEEQASRTQEERKKQNILNTVSRHLGEDVRDLPYLQLSSSRERSRSRSKSAAPENTVSVEEGSNPMVVNKEGEQQKRSKSGEASSSLSKKNAKKEENTLRKIEKSIARATAAEERQLKQMEKLKLKQIESMGLSKR